MHTVSTFPRTRRARRRQMAWGVLLWTELAEEKLRAGVPVSRLEFVLGQAEIEPICTWQRRPALCHWRMR
jgi:hypothetical protein